MKKVQKKSKVIELNKQDIKTLQRKQFLEKRRKQKQETKGKKTVIKFSKKDIIVLVAIAIGITIYYLISNYHKFGIVFNKNITIEDAVVIDTMYTDNIVLPYKDNILVFEKAFLITYDSKGNKVWEKELEEIYTPEIAVAGSFIQVTNNDTGYIYVFDGQYEVGRIKLEGEILSANINNEGTSVIEYTTSGLKTVLGVYNKKGNEIYTLKLDNNTVSCFGLSDNSKYLAYAYADISGISLVTKVDVVDLELLGNKDYTYSSIVNKNNELVYKMYWDNNNLHVLFNNSIVKYNAKSCDLEDVSISTINATNIDICENRIAYIKTEPNKAKYVLYVDKYALKNQKGVEIDEAPKHFIFSNELVYITTQNEINIYNKWGSKVKSYEAESTITKPIVFNNGKCVAMYIANKVIMFQI